ncbi:hypothetical protein [Plantactinospora endophytica]|uniref:Uncharacterized protein n=1 Tax=Plantactinospora endophytica TaxID=673535 RepID=A0ABQ4E7P0_9ACTN|nr:hypothetical protein [Plantactinospora endophytica]GIG90747.1 hypothetical protein Pen02_56830 [Plantactinospora endophytica]
MRSAMDYRHEYVDPGDERFGIHHPLAEADAARLDHLARVRSDGPPARRTADFTDRR